MAYTIEIYRGHQKAVRHFGIYALYVMFYPQLVAGPIERPQNLIHQFVEPHRFDAARVSAGLTRMLWGFFKKVVIADRLAVLVNQVYNHPADHSGLALVLATYAFAYQIYCDFSGYSDIAIGTAQVMGFNLMTNFDGPYQSRSVAEFWRRWHISLSTWFRDYLYIPLGGNRTSRGRWYANLFIVFVISGLWHGANWTFLIWGALHGLYLVAALVTERPRAQLAELIGLDRFPTLQRLLGVLVTFHLVTFAWIFFRASSLADALYVVRHLGGAFEVLASRGPWLTGDLGLSRFELALAALSVVFLESVQWLQADRRRLLSLRDWPLWLRWSVYYAAITAILLLGKFDAQGFIYFQF